MGYTKDDTIFKGLVKNGSGIITKAKLEQAKIPNAQAGNWKLLDSVDIDWNGARLSYVYDATGANLDDSSDLLYLIDEISHGNAIAWEEYDPSHEVLTAIARFVDEQGYLLYEQEIPIGTVPVYEGPAQHKDDDYYEEINVGIEYDWNAVDGWVPSLTNINRDTTFTVHYTERTFRYVEGEYEWKREHNTLDPAKEYVMVSRFPISSKESRDLHLAINSEFYDSTGTSLGYFNVHELWYRDIGIPFEELESFCIEDAEISTPIELLTTFKGEESDGYMYIKDMYTDMYVGATGNTTNVLNEMSALTIGGLDTQFRWVYDSNGNLDNTYYGKTILFNSGITAGNSRISGYGRTTTVNNPVYLFYKGMSKKTKEYIVVDLVKATFVNWDGTVLYTSTVPVGETPVYRGSEPTRKDEHTSWLFTGWAPELAPITENTTFVATYREVTYYTITFASNDETMGSAVAQYNGEDVTRITVIGGDDVTFTPLATVTSGHKFIEWSDGLVNGQEITLTNVNENKNFVASFRALQTFNITFASNDDTMGNAIAYYNGEPVSQIIAVEDTDVTFTPHASSNTGYTFVEWNDGLTNDTEVTIYGINENKSYVCTFRALQTFVLSFSSNDTSMGSAVAYYNGDQVSQINVYEGDDVTFTPHAVPNSGYVLQRWTDGLTNDVQKVLYSVNENKNYVAEFGSVPVHTITFVSNDDTMGTAQALYNGHLVNSISTPEGSEITFTPQATPNEGYVLQGWDGGLVDGIAETLSNVTSDKEYTATFRSGSEPTSQRYVFTTKDWGDSENGWTNVKSGGQFMSGRGVQVTTSVSGAGAKTVLPFNNVSRVVVTYSTNSSKGVGAIKATVIGDGTTTYEQISVGSTGGTTDRTADLTFTDVMSGNVNLEITCTQNSIYIKDITIYYEI